MNIFTKRNALIGYLTMQALTRKRRTWLPGRQKRSWKLPTLLALGIVSGGVLVFVALMLRKQRESEHIEGYVVAGGPERFDPESVEAQGLDGSSADEGIAEQEPSQAA